MGIWLLVVWLILDRWILIWLSGEGGVLVHSVIERIGGLLSGVAFVDDECDDTTAAAKDDQANNCATSTGSTGCYSICGRDCVARITGAAGGRRSASLAVSHAVRANNIC